MKLKALLITISVIFLSTTSLTAYANQIIFPLSKTSTLKTPQAFYCTLKENGKGDKIVRLTNWAQMVTGFQEGVLMIKPEELNSFYFLAYHDPSPFYNNEQGNVIVSAAGFTATCDYGTGNRKFIDRPYG
jgi:hypothetical protein